MARKRYLSRAAGSTARQLGQHISHQGPWKTTILELCWGYVDPSPGTCWASDPQDRTLWRDYFGPGQPTSRSKWPASSCKWSDCKGCCSAFAPRLWWWQSEIDPSRTRPAEPELPPSELPPLEGRKGQEGRYVAGGFVTADGVFHGYLCLYGQSDCLMIRANTATIVCVCEGTESHIVSTSACFTYALRLLFICRFGWPGSGTIKAALDLAIEQDAKSKMSGPWGRPFADFRTCRRFSWHGLGRARRASGGDSNSTQDLEASFGARLSWSFSTSSQYSLIAKWSGRRGNYWSYTDGYILFSICWELDQAICGEVCGPTIWMVYSRGAFHEAIWIQAFGYRSGSSDWSPGWKDLIWTGLSAVGPCRNVLDVTLWGLRARAG